MKNSGNLEGTISENLEAEDTLADNGCTSCSKGTSLYVFPLLVCDGKGYFYYNIKTNRQVHLIGFCNGIGSFVYQLKYLLSLGDVADFVHDNFDSK